MRRVDKLDLKIADIDDVVRLDRMDQDLVEHPMLFETLFGQADRESRGINRKVELLEYVSERPDVVLVPVGEDDRGQVVAVFFEKIKIGNRDVDAERRLFGKTHPGIDDDHLVGVADAHAVHPEFADAAERDYFYLIHETCSIAYGFGGLFAFLSGLCVFAWKKTIYARAK